MTDTFKERQPNYLSRDFAGFIRDAQRYLDAHHSGTLQDRNESSPGMALLELFAFIGDNLSYNLDQAFKELRQSSQTQMKNVAAFAKSLGYRPRGARAARCKQFFAIEIPATTDGIGNTVPDETYAPVLRKGARVGAPGGVTFESLEDIHFSSSDDRTVTGSRFDQSTGLPTHFAVRKPADVVAGKTVVDTFTVGEFEQFKTLELSQGSVVEVLSVVDSEGNVWSEVDYLAQDTVFTAVENGGDDNDEVPYTIKLTSVPRRFITDRDPTTDKTSLIFGSGDGVSFDDELIPNIADLALPLAGKNVVTSVSLDPQNFLKTRSLGLSPLNTTLTVKYRVGGGSDTNVPARSIRDVLEAELDFSSTSLDSSKVSDVRNSLETINGSRSIGGGPPETIPEIKANSSAFFAAQNRLVTAEDFKARILSLPEKFGRIEKALPRKSSNGGLTVDIHVLAKDANGHLIKATPNLKSNLKKYLSMFRMFTDGINILDTNIINLRCNFGVVVSKLFNRGEVLTRALGVVREYLKTENRDIRSPIVLSHLSAQVQKVEGVISVYELKFTNLFGSVDGLMYSPVRFDVGSNIANQILYCPENSIFEVKHPRKDIVGSAK